MKIALINDQPEYSGMGEYAFQLYRHLKNLCSVDHIFLNYAESRIERIEDHDRVLISKIKKTPVINNRVLFWLKCSKYISGYDLYHIVNHNLSLLSKGRRSIITHHHLSPAKYSDSVVRYYVRRSLHSWIKYANHIITVSNFTKQQLIRDYKLSDSDITVTYNGVSDSYKPRELKKIREQLGLPMDKKIILNIAGNGVRKNISNLIKSFNFLQKKIENTLLIRIGRERKENINLVKKLGLQDKVVFLEYVPRDKIPFYYNASDLFAFPSLCEACPMVLLEAMASGCPILAADASSIPEILGSAGILVDPFNIDDMKTKMFELLSDAELRKEMSKKSLERSEFFNWEKVAEKTLEIYSRFAPS